MTMHAGTVVALLASPGEVERFSMASVIGGALACFAVLAVAVLLVYRGVRLMRRVRAAAARGVELLPDAYRPRIHTPEVPLAQVQAKGRRYAVIGGVFLLVSAVMWWQHQTRYQELGVTTPPTAGGLPRLHHAEYDRVVARHLNALERDPTVEEGMAAVYGSPERPVFVAAGTLSQEPSDTTASGLPGEFFVQLRRKGRLPGRSEPHPPGVRGGHMSCMRLASATPPSAACIWVDDWTLGVVAMPGASTAEVAELTRNIRVDVER